MQTASPTVYRLDYQSYPYDIVKVNLRFELDPALTRVSNTMLVRAKPSAQGEMILNGEEIQLESVWVNQIAHTNYEYVGHQLILKGLPEQFELCLKSTCQPDQNSTLMGLYVSGQSFFTQCEAEGFRRITFFADRPDVMSEYFVTLEADKSRYPYLLSNGNLISQQDLSNGRHQAKWHDPFLKPCYLFALVAGDFDIRERHAKTASGRPVLLQIYSDRGHGEQTLWALNSLERAMHWDEQRFGLALDLDRFMVVAVRDFNMGAMENKGLNIFNAAYVLADPQSATDMNYQGIESVIGHEYFHNWTGNRVTCRDWFQLSLKEGLTVFRDQEFSADMMARDLPVAAAESARSVKRIEDVSRLRSAQFSEDAGPMAHPIRPDSYQEIGNFYTATVYEKGAEVIRMQHTLLGEVGFLAGMGEYFRRHDGQAVTCDDFINAMEFVYQQQNPDNNFNVFRRWYSQAGTPHVEVISAYDETTEELLLTLKQHCPKVGVEKLKADFNKLPFHIPLHIGLLYRDGRHMDFDPSSLNHAVVTDDGVLLELTEAEQQWRFKQIHERPILSLLRNFSAPVIIDYPREFAELAILCRHDSNPFARWEAGQELMSQEILRLSECLEKGQQAQLNPIVIEVFRHNLSDPELDAAYRSWLLTLPSEKILSDRMTPVQPQTLCAARDFVRAQLAHSLTDLWLQTYQQQHQTGSYSPDPISVGQRSLKNLALSYLVSIHDPQAIILAATQYHSAQNMTDRFGALSALVNFYDGPQTQSALVDFYEQFKHDPLVVDKWFALQASSSQSTTQKIRTLIAHPDFTLRNPNRVRALVFQFCNNNLRNFHQADGYEFWVELLIQLDGINPEVAARLARAMDSWGRFAEPLRGLMQQALQRVASQPSLSKNSNEIISKALSI